MNRRDLLSWISRGLAASVTLVIGLPGFRYILGSVQPDAKGESRFARLMRVKDLVAGRPVIAPVMGQKQDAWTRHDQQVLGRVWLVRDPGNSDSSKVSVRAFSSICPHMGCQVQAQSGTKNFVCPCHRATFGVDGHRLLDARTGDRNPAPRDLDELECRLECDETTGDQWVEVKYEKFKNGLDHPVVGG